jgi:N-acetyl-1-D-myo-inositol-2-amino-2-deoxy-alpha-D-glucopyranoside deacetylase
VPGLLAFHAHPDDESLSMGGTLARYAAGGEQVVVVTATRGEVGEIHNHGDPEALRDSLGDVREAELRAACGILGVTALELLGYRDSGMAGTPDNDNPEAFWRADFMEAVGRLVRLIRKYRPEVMTAYDPFGGYGHPDHIQVHHVGRRAAALAGTPRVYAATVSREYFVEFATTVGDLAEGMDVPDPEAIDLGVADALITTRVDVTSVLDRKQAAMAAHGSQIPADSFFLGLPPDQFRVAFGTEWYIRLDETPATEETWIF